MEPIQQIISSNLRKMRASRKLSLDDLSSITGVSKSLLRQIEKEESNPTITTIWKIADGLKIPFTSLMEKEIPNTVVVSKDNVEPLLEEEGDYRLFPHFSYEEQKPVEIYSIELEPGTKKTARAHHSGAIECLTVYQGTFCMTVGEVEYMLQAGDAIKFKADLPHTYSNPGDSLTVVNMVIYYPGE